MTRKVLVVASAEDYRRFTAACPDSAAFEVFAARPQVAVDLMLAGVPARTLAETVPVDVAPRLYEAASRDARRLTAAAAGAAPINLAQIFEVWMWELLHEAYALDWALRVWGVEGRDEVAYVAPRGRPRGHVELADPALLIGHAFDHAFTQPQAYRPRRLDFGRAPGLGLKGTARELVRMAAGLRPRRPAVPDLPRGAAVAWASGHDALIVLPEAAAMARREGRPLVHVGTLPQADSERTGLVMDPAWRDVARVDLNADFAKQRLRLLSLAGQRRALRALSAVQGELSRILVGYTFNLADHVAGLEADYLDAAARAVHLDAALARLAGSRVVLTDFNGVPERILEQRAPAHGVEILARPHGWLANPEGYAFRTGKVLVPGRMQADFMRAWHGVEAEVAPEPHLARAAAEAKGEGAALLVLATMSRNRILNEFGVARFKAAWGALFDWAARHPEVPVVVKSHPTANYDRWIEAEAARRGLANITVKRGRLETVLPEAALVLDFGYPGTATLTTLAAGRPVVIFSGLYRYTRGLTEPVLAAAQGFHAADCGRLAEMLDDWRARPDRFAAEILALNAPMRDALFAET